MTSTRQGPFIQELFVYDAPTRQRLIAEALDLGATAIGIVPWEPFSQHGRTQPFKGRDLAAVKASHLRAVRQLVRWCSRRGCRVYLYGLMGPWARHGNATGYRFHGREIPADAWRSWSGDAQSGCLRYLARLSRFTEQLEGDVRWVDGVEPFMGPLQPGPPANAYQSDVQHLIPGALQHVAQGRYGEISAAPETHVNPGDADRSGHGGGGLATDGWGRSTREWLMPDGRALRFAGLPLGDTRKEVVACFADLYRDAVAMDREALLVLHTAAWDVFSMNGPARAGFVGVDVDPWGAIYRRLAALEAEGPASREDGWPASEVQFLHGRGVDDWAVTSSLASIRIDPEATIELRHSMGGRWPVLNGAEGNAWVVAHINGRLRAWTWEWLRPGQALKYVPGRELGLRAELPPGPDSGPVMAWSPSAGEEVGFFVSTPARHGPGTADERSNIVTVRWPS